MIATVTTSKRTATWLALAMIVSSCATLSNSDPLTIGVAGIEPLPSEGLELRLAVRVRVQNPNDLAVDYSGAALSLDLNGRKLASGVSDQAGTVPRYGETLLTIPVTISAFDVARQVLVLANGAPQNDVPYLVRGKLEGGLFGTRRFRAEGTLSLPESATDVSR